MNIIEFFKKNSENKSAVLLQGAFIVALIVFVVWLSGIAGESGVVKDFVVRYGYLGILLLALVSGFNLVVPIPAVTFMPVFLAAGLNFWLTIFFITIGMTLGDSIGYLIGRFGRNATKNRKIPEVMKKMELLSEKYTHGVPLFFFIYSSIAPFPNELVVIPAAFMNIRWYYILVPVLFGNMIFNILVGTGLIGIISIF